MFLLKIFFFQIFVTLSYCYLEPIEYRIPLGGERPLPGSPWPMPQVWNKTRKVFTLDPRSFQFTSNFQNCIIIQNAIRRYKDIVFIDKQTNKSNNFPVLNQIHISIENVSCGYPNENDDESYEIIIDGSNGTGLIRANTVWGALHGLETFSQLVYQHAVTKQYFINATYINDWPSYSFRAILLDTARHYIPVKVILANLDAMAYNKFNVFHWHIVDDQSFPFQSQVYPTLSQKGAYSPKHIYTYQDIHKIIQFARMRGIRVIPELDSPGHTHGIGRAFPELLTPCYGQGKDKPNTPNYPFHAARDYLNPMINQTYLFMKDLFMEFKRLFKDGFVHLGMDEVYYKCWESSPEIENFMKQHQMQHINEVENYYIRKTIENVKDIGYKYILYQDPADNNVTLASDSIVIVWKDHYLDSSMDYWQNYISKLAKKGHHLILSACWYLNYIEYPYPGRDWEKHYLCDPRNFPGNNSEKSLVIGGEACIWAEFADGTNMLSRLWPRASAVAERLWTNPKFYPELINNTRFRIDYHRCRMLQRGIPAAPILNGYCGDFEWGMDSNQIMQNINVGDRIHLKDQF